MCGIDDDLFEQTPGFKQGSLLTNGVTFVGRMLESNSVCCQVNRVLKMFDFQ